MFSKPVHLCKLYSLLVLPFLFEKCYSVNNSAFRNNETELNKTSGSLRHFSTGTNFPPLIISPSLSHSHEDEELQKVSDARKLKTKVRRRTRLHNSSREIGESPSRNKTFLLGRVRPKPNPATKISPLKPIRKNGNGINPGRNASDGEPQKRTSKNYRRESIKSFANSITENTNTLKNHHISGKRTQKSSSLEFHASPLLSVGVESGPTIPAVGNEGYEYGNWNMENLLKYGYHPNPNPNTPDTSSASVYYDYGVGNKPHNSQLNSFNIMTMSRENSTASSGYPHPGKTNLENVRGNENDNGDDGSTNYLQNPNQRTNQTGGKISQTFTPEYPQLHIHASNLYKGNGNEDEPNLILRKDLFDTHPYYRSTGIGNDGNSSDTDTKVPNSHDDMSFNHRRDYINHDGGNPRRRAGGYQYRVHYFVPPPELQQVKGLHSAAANDHDHVHDHGHGQSLKKSNSNSNEGDSVPAGSNGYNNGPTPSDIASLVLLQLNQGNAANVTLKPVTASSTFSSNIPQKIVDSNLHALPTTFIPAVHSHPHQGHYGYGINPHHGRHHYAHALHHPPNHYPHRPHFSEEHGHGHHYYGHEFDEGRVTITNALLGSKYLKKGTAVVVLAVLFVALVLAGFSYAGVHFSPLIFPLLLLPIAFISLILFIPLLVLYIPILLHGLAGGVERRHFETFTPRDKSGNEEADWLISIDKIQRNVGLIISKLEKKHSNTPLSSI